MQIPTIVVLLATVGLSTAAPAAIADLAADSVTVRVNPSKLVSKRDTTQCAVDSPRLTEARVADIVSQLSADSEDISAATGTQGQLINCIGGTGLFLSVDAQDPSSTVTLHSQDVATDINNAFNTCYEHFPDSGAGDSSFEPAYQYFGDGWNLLVHGSAC